MRKPPDITPPETITPRQLALIEQKREYKLITPLYGGGVTPAEADPVTIIRATEIRGQLRFWWRACRGWKFGGEGAAMKAEEDAIWGKAYKKGDQGLSSEQTIQIIVEIDPSKPGESIKPFVVQRKRARSINDIPDYAAFPLQPDRDKLQQPQPHIPDVRKEVHFTLTIVYPQAKSEEVEAALWAWETFGGIGARTRRGFGALHLLKINDTPYKYSPFAGGVEQWIAEQLEKYVKPGKFPAGIPHLSREMLTRGHLVVTAFSADPMRTWKRLINDLRNFRQSKDEDSERSSWPEAEAIRAITDKELKNSNQETLQKFPRAAFGLPVIFHFTGDNEPADVTLKEAGQDKERFASPLILRPFLYGDRRAVGLALLLEGSRVDLEHLALEGDDLKGKQPYPYPVQGTLTGSEAQQIAVLKKETDILQAFMKSLKEEQ